MEEAVATSQDQLVGQTDLTIVRARRRTACAHGNYALIGAILLIAGEVIVAAIRAVGALARQVRTRLRQYQQAMATREALTGLDDRTLRDLGFHRSEIDSITASLVGRSESDRRVRRG